MPFELEIIGQFETSIKYDKEKLKQAVVSATPPKTKSQVIVPKGKLHLIKQIMNYNDEATKLAAALIY
jgi:hypothetical protein